MSLAFPLAVPSDELHKAGEMLRVLYRIRQAWEAGDEDELIGLMSDIDAAEALETSVVLKGFALLNGGPAE